MPSVSIGGVRTSGSSRPLIVLRSEGIGTVGIEWTLDLNEPVMIIDQKGEGRSIACREDDLYKNSTCESIRSSSIICKHDT